MGQDAAKRGCGALCATNDHEQSFDFAFLLIAAIADKRPLRPISVSTLCVFRLSPNPNAHNHVLFGIDTGVEPLLYLFFCDAEH